MDVTGFRHTDLGEYSADASDLGFAPGHWPKAFTATVDGTPREFSYVNGHIDRDGDLTHVEYRCPGVGYRFVVWND